MKYFPVAAILALSVLHAPAVEAARAGKAPLAPVTDCDRLSGMPPTQGYATFDVRGLRYREGRTAGEMELIIAACRDAAKSYPDEARFPFRLGMALRDRGATDEAMAAFAAAQKQGSLGGYDEAATLLFFGNRNDAGFKRDGKAGLELINQGIAKHNAPILQASKALGLLFGPEEIRDTATGVAILRGLVKKNDILGTVILADYFARSNNEAERKEAVTLYQKADQRGSGYGARELALLLWRDKPSMAIKVLERAAERGNIKAIDLLGYAYQEGHGVAKNPAKARAFYERAALQGYAVAQYRYAMVFRSGEDVPLDYVKARHWLELAVAQGSAVAMYDLGMMYDHAIGVPQDWAKARALYERSAALGNAQSMNNMGYLFVHGRAAPVDYVKAREWYEKAVAKGNVSAASNLASLYQDGHGVERDYAKALELLEISAAGKSSYGTNNLANAYLKGSGVKADPVKARELFRLAIDYGSSEALHNLAGMYECGTGGARDYDAARALFKRSAERGIVNGLYRYAMRLFYDEADGKYNEATGYYSLASHYGKAREQGRDAVYDEIRNLLTKAVAANDLYGVELLAEMVADGIGGDRDPVEAVRLFRIAGENHLTAKISFAKRLRSGQGVPADSVEARRLMTELVRSEFPFMVVQELVEMMDAGEGGAKDVEGATRLLRAQSDNDDMLASQALVPRLINGIGTARDPATARILLASLASKGDIRAYGMLGLMYEHGEGGAESLADAAAFYQLGHDKEDDFSSSRLAMLLRDGRGIAADPVRARDILGKIVILWDPEAMMTYVAMLDKGEGGPPNPEEAANQLFHAAFIMRAPAAVSQLRNPEGAFSGATRKALIEILQKAGFTVPAADGKGTALIDEATEAKLMAVIGKR